MKTQLLSSMGSFVLGGSVALVGLLSWTGTADLGTIKESVQSYVTESEIQASLLVSDYQVTVDQANTEIRDYQDALALANDNIEQLITVYEKAELKYQEELEQAQASAEQDLAELEQALVDMQSRLDSQYETDMNAIIEQANAEIEMANQEVAQAKDDVNDIIESSSVEDIVAELGNVELDTTGDKTVTDITEILSRQE